MSWAKTQAHLADLDFIPRTQHVALDLLTVDESIVGATQVLQNGGAILGGRCEHGPAKPEGQTAPSRNSIGDRW